MATNSKQRKNHKKKVANRNQRLKEQKSRMDKMQREFIMNLIKQEQEKGLYENVKPLDGPVTDGPILDGPVFGSPVIDGPVIDTPVISEETETSEVVESDVVESEVVVDNSTEESN